MPGEISLLVWLLTCTIPVRTGDGIVIHGAGDGDGITGGATTTTGGRDGPTDGTILTGATPLLIVIGEDITEDGVPIMEDTLITTEDVLTTITGIIHHIMEEDLMPMQEAEEVITAELALPV